MICIFPIDTCSSVLLITLTHEEKEDSSDQTFIVCLLLGLVDSAAEGDAGGSVLNGASVPTRSQRPSLSKIILSMEGSQSKRHALSHLLQALQVLYAR